MYYSKFKNTYIYFKVLIVLFLVLVLALSLIGCGDSNTGSSTSKGEASNVPQQTTNGTYETNNSSKDNHDNKINLTKGNRDNTPYVLTPTATGDTVFSCDVADIDVSNVTEGYIMVRYLGDCAKVKLQIKGPDGVTYTYNLDSNVPLIEDNSTTINNSNSGYEVFPLTAGDGQYTFGIYENIAGTKYSTTLSKKMEVSISNTFGPYLYPNQYVDFLSSSLPVDKAKELAFPANNDLEVVEDVYNYIITNFTYDYEKAASVASGYLPVIDKVFLENTGICFDYAAVMATMLRTQNIPTRLEVGYVGEEYHAWISVYIEEIGWLNGLIEFNGRDWNMLDPTFASASRQPTSFITDNQRYLTKYVY